MAYFQIPTQTDSDNYEFQLSLEGSAYTFIFVWNYRESCWEISIADIAYGIAIRIGVDVLASIPIIGKPPGRLVAGDTSGQGLDPGLEDLGGRVVLLYEESTT